MIVKPNAFPVSISTGPSLLSMETVRALLLSTGPSAPASVISPGSSPVVWPVVSGPEREKVGQGPPVVVVSPASRDVVNVGGVPI